MRSDPSGGFEITVVFTSGDVAPKRAKLNPSASALKFLGIGADILEAYELDDASDEKDVSDSEPEPDSESDLYGIYCEAIAQLLSMNDVSLGGQAPQAF